VLGFEKRKAFGNEIRFHFYIVRAADLRKLCSPGIFAPRTPKNFSPMVVSGHPASMRPSRSRSSQLSCHNPGAERVNAGARGLVAVDHLRGKSLA
jgi:hypothetical protein